MARSHERLSKAAVVAAALQEHRSTLRSFVRARVRPNEVEDVVQVAAVRAMEKAESLDDPDRVLAWLYRLYRNTIVDAIRKRASQRRLIDETAPVPEHAGPESASLCRCSVSQAKNMSPNYASILALVDLGDSTLREAAQILGVSITNATVRLHRARKALKQRMLDHCGVKSFRDCADCRCVHDGCCTA